MASIKVHFRASSIAGGDGTLYYRIIHNRVSRQIQTGIHIGRGEWDEHDGNIILSGPPERFRYLTAACKQLDDSLCRLNRIVSVLEKAGKPFTTSDVVNLYLDSGTVVGFISFTRNLIEENRKMGRRSTVEHYSSALNSFIRFNGDKDLSFDEISPQLMEAYECSLKAIGLSPNTTSYYMRKLRAIFNTAIDRGLADRCNPFRHVYTGIAKTKKRAVTLDTIKSLRDMDLSCDPLSALARDMFLFSFYTRGMSLVDMSYLRKSNLRNEILTYRRKKTSQLLYIRWEDRMQEIVDRHAIPDSEFLLPLIRNANKDHRRQYQNASHLINRRLKKLGVALGLTEPLTMYRARHAWASIAHLNNIPIAVISEGMGHETERTTRIYLTSLNSSVVDKANFFIMNLLDS